jgi:VWFA-related protein
MKLGSPPPTDTTNQSPFKLQVRSNLVVVRVVIRDAQGKSVEGLKKEDFHLFDKGKEQTITQFEVESSVAPPSNPTVTNAPGKTSPPLAMPGRFLALFFDDLNASDADMIQARDGTDHYLAASLQPKDRVAIFTSSKVLTDFTADPKQIHEALFKLHVSPRALNRFRECPDLSDYQAAQINQFQEDTEIDAWKMALDEMANNPACPKGGDPKSYVVMQARNIVSQAEIQSRTSLQELERMVRYMSQMPGQRTVIMVSPGFLSQSEQYQLDRIIDRALRSQVVISSLDPKGLALLMRETDVTRSYTPTANSGVIGATHSVDWEREAVAGDVLAELAQGTGGEFFHNNNDLKAGFGALAGSPLYYILAFAPAEVKPDGRFHALKVTLAEKEKGVTIQARRGYFAPENEAEAEAEAKEQATSDAEAQAQEQIREAILAKADVQQFPIALRAKLSEGQGDKRELSLFAHLDAAPLHFHKDGEHNLNTVTFVFAIFDQKENLVDSQQRRARVNVLDAQLPELFKAGVDAGVTFQLKPGVYRIREVVTDSEEHHMTTFSKNVKIP